MNLRPSRFITNGDRNRTIKAECPHQQDTKTLCWLGDASISYSQGFCNFVQQYSPWRDFPNCNISGRRGNTFAKLTCYRSCLFPFTSLMTSHVAYINTRGQSCKQHYLTSILAHWRTFWRQIKLTTLLKGCWIGSTPTTLPCTKRLNHPLQTTQS